MALPGVRAGVPDRGYDIVIIGAGVQGLALAYELAQRGARSVAVLDRSWPGNGASGRNGELIRSAFSSAAWCGLFDYSLSRWQTLSAELNANLLFNRHGYIVLASTDAQWRACKRDHERHKDLGINSNLVDYHDVRRLLPEANPDLIRGGVLQPDAGFAHHDIVVWAYLAAASRLGVEVYGDVSVDAIRTRDGRVRGIRAGGHDVDADVVVNAAGGAAAEINHHAGVDIELRASRLEMLATEPLRPFLRHGLAVPELMGYAHQTARGEFVGGTELPQPDHSSSLNATYALLRDMAAKWVTLFPALAGARLLRHWAGTVTQAADLAPVIGPTDELDGYFVTCGWVYGFMGAPGAADLLANHIVTGRRPALLEPFAPARLREGNLIHETSLVVPT